MRTLTYQTLSDKRACKDQLDAFRALFNESVDITPELCVTHAATFDWSWAADSLLSPAAWAEYKRATAPAWEKYDHATATALAEYKRATATALAKYKRASASALAEYKRAVAAAWADAYINNMK